MIMQPKLIKWPPPGLAMTWHVYHITCQFAQLIVVHERSSLVYARALLNHAPSRLLASSAFIAHAQQHLGMFDATVIA